MGFRPIRVSVLITTFDHESFIARALDSVVEQRLDDRFEVLVGDDCSSDGTRAIIERYASEHPELIATYFPPQNLGGGGSRMLAALIERSHGEYIAKLDGDDYWTSALKLRRQVEYLDANPQCSMCFHNAVCHWEDGSRADTPHNDGNLVEILDVAALLDHNPVASCSFLMRRGIVDSLPAWYFSLPWGDWPMYFLAAQTGEIHYLPDVMGVYRIHSRGLYSGLTTIRSLELLIDFYRGIGPAIPPAYDRIRRERLATAWERLAIEHDRSGDAAEARRCLRASFAASPPTRPWRRPDGRRLARWMLLRSPAAGRLWRARRRPPERPASENTTV